MRLWIQKWNRLKRRPLDGVQLLGAAFRFWRTKVIMDLFPGLWSGVDLGRNARVQALSCLKAEAPSARVRVGEDSILYEFAQVHAYGSGSIELGRSCVIGDARIYSRHRIRFGDRCITSWNVFIQDFDPHPLDSELRGYQIERLCARFWPQYSPPLEVGWVGSEQKDRALEEWNFPGDSIEIGDDVWIGANVTILRGARIGSGSIVATGAVVLAGEYPKGSVLAGVPAKLVKRIPVGAQRPRDQDSSHDFSVVADASAD